MRQKNTPNTPGPLTTNNKDSTQLFGGPWEKAGRWVDDTWRVLVAPFAAVGMASFAVFLTSPRWWTWAGFILSCLGAIAGAVLSVRLAKRDSELQKQIQTLQNKLDNTRDPKRVFFIASALAEDWQIMLEQALVFQLWSHGFHPTILSPLHHYTPHEQDGHFREILERQEDYVGGFVIPIEPENRRVKLQKFAESFGKPIVFVDNAPFERDEEYPSRTRFVGVNSAEGGRLAAKAAMSKVNIELKRVLVIASNTQVGRQSSFKEELRKVHPMCEIVIDQSGRFNRDSAYRVAFTHLTEAINNNHPFDVVFNTCDAMTLGCLDAVEVLATRGESKKPRIIGYDGIALTRKLAEDGNSALERVVVQDTHNIAVAAVEQLVRLLSGEKSKAAEWVEPYLYPELPEMDMGDGADLGKVG